MAVPFTAQSFMQSIFTGALLRDPQIKTSGTTYTTIGSTILVELIGGGGGGGGAQATSTQVSVGSGGGAGAYARKLFTGLIPGTSLTYAIGAAGAANSGAAGGNGGSTTFAASGITVTAPGGTGGGTQVADTTALYIVGGLGGTAPTNADLACTGMPGKFGKRWSSTVGFSGQGGNNPFFGGSQPGRASVNAGLTALSFGCGGSGAYNTGTVAAKSGGAGTAGLIIIWEFS